MVRVTSAIFILALGRTDVGGPGFDRVVGVGIARRCPGRSYTEADRGGIHCSRVHEGRAVVSPLWGGPAERESPLRVRPAQTASSAPVTSAAASLARKRMARATDSGDTHPLRSAVGMARRFASVSIVLGRTALTV